MTDPELHNWQVILLGVDGNDIVDSFIVVPPDREKLMTMTIIALEAFSSSTGNDTMKPGPECNSQLRLHKRYSLPTPLSAVLDGQKELRISLPTESNSNWRIHLMTMSLTVCER